MKYCMKVPTYIKKKNKQTNTKTDLHPAIWILPQFQHHLPKMTANISREWGWLGKYTRITNASVCYKYQHTTFCSPQHWLNNVLSTFEH